MESNPRTKSAVDGRETAQGDISEEITMRNAFGNTAELHTEGEAITIISLPTCKHQQLTNTERPQTGWSPTHQEMEKKLRDTWSMMKKSHISITEFQEERKR